MGKKKTEKRLGSVLVNSLTEFRDALSQSNKTGKRLSSKYTVRSIELDLKPGDYDAEAVRITRARIGASQAIFAQLLGLSVDLVQSWEQGVRKPQPIACRLLDEINKNPQYWIDMIKNASRKMQTPVY